ncbi:hypothetical protein [Chryseobacterium indoltheticum]|uniref:hypothetical protein n=1 Tax=Chryseobacterium indoltheticum TaxID=254 RepID=UPI003F49666A
MATKYIDNVQKYSKRKEDFDISGLIENFKQAVISSTSSVDTIQPSIIIESYRKITQI